MPRLIRLFVSSPSDVPKEREVVDRVARDLERFCGGELQFDVIRWERQALEATGSFQHGIQRKLSPEDMDIAVFIVWQRLGSPLGRAFTHPETGKEYDSGTEYEFDMMINAWEKNGRTRPRILFYVKEDAKSVALQAVTRGHDTSAKHQIEQHAALDAFIQARFNAPDGTNVRAYHTFPDPLNFQSILQYHLRDAIRELIKDEETDLDQRLRATWHGDPFPGLRAFKSDEHDIFFGRDSQTYTAIEALNAKAAEGVPFLLVIGASGSGKSSLARAGIVPRLREGFHTPGATVWREATLVPADEAAQGDLCARLVRALLEPGALPELQTSESRRTELEEVFRTAPQTVPLFVRDALKTAAHAANRPPAEARVVLLLDQFEELFTDRCVTAEDRALFMAAINMLVRSGLVWVIATVRSDFYPQVQELPFLLDLKEGRGTLDLLPPNPVELAQIIQYPVHAAGLRYEGIGASALDKIILDDALALGGAAFLPLLQFALAKLHEARHEGQLTMASYTALGGVTGTLAAQADKTYKHLGPAAQAAFGETIALLVSVSDDDREVRLRARREVLVAVPAREEVVDAFLKARLFIADKDTAGHAIVTLAHEALLVHWPLAMKWVTENREFLRARKRLEAAAAIWSERGRDAEYLLAEGKPLAEAEELLRDHPGSTSPAAVALIEASRNAANERAERVRREREERLIADRRKARRWLAAVSVVAVVAVVLAGVSWLLFERAEQAMREAKVQRLKAVESAIAEAAQRKAAEDAKRESDAEKLRAEENAARADAERVAAEAARDASDRLLASSSVQLANSWLAEQRVDLAKAALNESPDRYRGWDWGYARALSNPELLSLQVCLQGVEYAELSPDGAMLVSISKDNLVQLWNASTGELVLSLEDHTSGVITVTFSPDSSRLLITGADNITRLWEASTGTIVGTLEGHSASVNSARFSPDGSRIVTTSEDGTARLWETFSGSLVVILAGHTSEVTSADFSPDGSRILTTSKDGTARLWEASSGSQIGVLLGHESGVNSGRMSSDGTKIATASTDNTIRIWDATYLTLIDILRGHSDAVKSVVFSRDGTRIFSIAEDSTARVWDADSRSPLGVLSPPQSFLNIMTFSHDGRMVATTASDLVGEISSLYSRDNTIRLWDSISGKLLGVFAGHEDEVNSLSFSMDDRLLISTAKDGTLRIWDVLTILESEGYSDHFSAGNTRITLPVADGDGTLTGSNIAFMGTTDPILMTYDIKDVVLPSVLDGHKSSVRAATFDREGSSIVTSSHDGSVRIWDSATGIPKAVMEDVLAGRGSAAFTSDSRHVVVSSWKDSSIRSFDSISGEHINDLPGHKGWVLTADFSPDGSLILTGSSDKTTRLWDATSGELLDTLSGHDGWVRQSVFTSDGSRIVTCSMDGAAAIWNPTNRNAFAFIAHTEPINTVDLNADDTLMVTASEDGTAILWDIEAKERLFTLNGHKGGVNMAGFNSEGSQIVTASQDGTARIWSSATGDLIAELQGHSAAVTSAAFSKDDRKIVTASEDGTALIWDTAKSDRVASLIGHSERVRFAAFTPDGKTVVTTSNDGTARLWDSTLGTVRFVLSGHTGAVLTAAIDQSGNYILTGSGDGTARIWDAETGKHLETLAGHSGWVGFVKFSPNGDRALTASADGSALVWDVATAKSLVALHGFSDWMKSGSASSDGTRYFTGGPGNSLVVRDLATGESFSSCQGHSDSIITAGFSPNGRYIVTSSKDRTTKIWNSSSGELVTTLRGHADEVMSSCFNPDSTLVVTSSRDNTAIVWEVASGSLLATLNEHMADVVFSSFSPDGTRIATASDDGTARIWEAAPYRHNPGSSGSDGLPLEEQFKLWKLQRYRDWQVRKHAESLGPDTLYGDPRLQTFRAELTQKFRDAYPQWAQWF